MLKLDLEYREEQMNLRIDVLDLEYREEHIDAEVLRNLIEMLLAICEKWYPDVFRVASGEAEPTNVDQANECAGSSDLG